MTLTPSLALEQARPYGSGGGVARRERRHRIYLQRAMIWTVIATATIILIVAGLDLRRWTWEVTDGLRFVPDTTRHCYWALETTGPEGFLNQYDKMALQTRDWENFLDYVPLRLLVMRQWGVYLRHHFPEIAKQNPMEAWQRSYEFTAPLLHFNVVMDGVGAVCAFFLTRLWVRRGWIQRRGALAGEPRHFVGVLPGLFAALFLWFNPAILLSAYAWPTWDSWIAPMYLLAVLLASLDWWFCAGVVLGIGAMLKGQQLAIAPIFVLWPLLQGRIGAALRWAVGLIFCMAVIASPWLLSYIPADQLNHLQQLEQNYSSTEFPPTLFAVARVIDVPAICWIAGIAIVATMVSRSRRWIPVGRSSWIGLVFAAVLISVSWPWFLQRNRSGIAMGLMAGAALAAAVIWLRRSSRPFVLAGALGCSLLLCMSVFNATDSWWHCGFVFGATRWHWFGESLTNSLPGLLLERYGWSKDPDVFAFTLGSIHSHWPAWMVRGEWWPAVSIDVTTGQLFTAIYSVVLVVSGIAVSLAARRNDRRMLLALTTPWIVFFVFPAEVHGRYLLFPATISCICIGQSLGMALLGMFLTAVATIQLLNDLMQGGDLSDWSAKLSIQHPSLLSPDWADRLYRFVQQTHPDLTWPILLITGVFLYQSFVPTRKLRSMR